MFLNTSGNCFKNGCILIVKCSCYMCYTWLKVAKAMEDPIGFSKMVAASQFLTLPQAHPSVG